MPRRNQPKSLVQAAMRSIARNFEYLCYNCRNSEDTAIMLESESYLLVEGPFLTMPPSICVGLLDALREVRGHIRRYHLVALLHQYQEEFSMSDIGDATFALNLIKTRCVRLRKLNLAYVRFLNPGNVLQLIPSLTNVVCMNLMKTEIMDQVLELIGIYCKELRELDISYCPVTNRGLHKLCYDEASRKSRSRKLTRLNIAGTMINKDAVGFLLLRIPTLRDIDFDNTFQILNMMGSRALNLIKQDSHPVFYLTQLTSTDDCVNEECAEVSVTLCPMATHVTINNSYIENEVLYKTMVLENLAHLRLTNTDSLTLDFHEGVLPVLSVRGERLISLLLAKFSVVDIQAIGDCCPKLNNLALSSVGFFQEILYPRDNIFTELNVLEIWTDLFVESMDKVILKQLLAYCPRLRNLLINGSRAFSDDVLMEIWSRNKMRELSRLTLQNCPHISRLSLDHLLDSTNELVLMRIWGCFLISREDNNYLQRRIKKENCDVYLEWFSWQG